MLTHEEYGVRLAELSKVRLILDSDPLTDGLLGITSKLADIQNHLHRASHLLTEAISNKGEAEIMHKSATFDYEQKLNLALATDKNVSTQKTAELRKATANNQLTKEMLDQHHAQMDYIEADSYLKAVRQIHTELDSTKDILSRQVSVIQMGIGIGEISREDLGKLFPNKDEKTLTLEK